MFGSKRTSTPTKPKTLVRAPINGKFRRVARRLFGGGNNTPARNAKSILTRKYRVLRKYPNIVNKYLIAPRSLSPMTPPRRYKPRSPLPLSVKPRPKGVSVGVGTSASTSTKSVSVTSSQRKAALRIQKMFRGFQARKNVHRMRSLNRKQRAALRIQRVYRGHMIRRKYAEEIKTAKKRAFRLLGMQRNALIGMKRPPSWVTEFFNYLRWHMTPTDILSRAKAWSKSKKTRIAALGIMFIAAVWYASFRLPDGTGSPPPPTPESLNITEETFIFLVNHTIGNKTFTHPDNSGF
jgi:hypothetical protein